MMYHVELPDLREESSHCFTTVLSEANCTSPVRKNDNVQILNEVG